MAEEEVTVTTTILPPRGELGVLTAHSLHVLSHCILLEEDGSGGPWALRSTGKVSATPEKRGRCQELLTHQL